MAPVLLPANQPEDRFYKGGAQISGLRGNPPCSPYQPEDWVASTTCCFGCEASRIGMSRLPNGVYLKDAIAADPNTWLGEDHVKKFGVDTKLLVKLLDAGQRLPVHAHPHVDWAKKHVGAAHGKAEAWYFLTGGEVYLGLKEDIPMGQLLELVQTQNVETLLAKMHRLAVRPHQTVYVPPGTLHAIGEKILLVEVQEPEDMSILLEWKGFQIDGEKEGHLGLGFETALTAVDNKGKTEAEISRLVTGGEGSGSVLAQASNEYFELERLTFDGEQSCRPGFAVLVVLDGETMLSTGSGSSLPLKKGSTVVLPHADGEFKLRGAGDVLIARPPRG